MKNALLPALPQESPDLSEQQKESNEVVVFD
jgi:hypothetical protein